MAVQGTPGDRRHASGHHTSTGGSLRPRISILDDAWLLRAPPELRLPESPLSAAFRTRDPRDRRAFQKPSTGDWIPDRQRDVSEWGPHAVSDLLIPGSFETDIHNSG